MECFANPAYMSGACPATCGSCVNIKALQNDGRSADEIRRKRKFAETDFGLWQSIPKDGTADAVRTRIKEMGKYMQRLEQEERTGRGTACNNIYHDCATWASSPTQNCESNMDFMINHCSLVCQYCHVVEQYHTCRQTERSQSEQPFYDWESVRTHLLATSKGAVNLVEGSCSAKNVTKNDSDAEWVLSMKWSDLWETETEGAKSVENLVELLKADDMSWENAAESKDKAAITFDGNKPLERMGQIRIASEQFHALPPYEDFIARISATLKVPQPNLEVEYVRYKRGERHASHLDYRIHDSWKPSGSRALSLYVVLQRPKIGGNFGFPLLDYLLVEDPEILIWPNVQVKDGIVQPLSNLENEQLPVVEGELYAAHVWVHEYPFDRNASC